MNTEHHGSLRRLLRGSLLYTLSATMVGVTRVLMMPVITKNLSTTEYGWYALAVATAMVMAMLGTLGFDGAVGRAYFDPQQNGFTAYLRSVLVFQLCWNVVLMSTLVAGSHILLLAFAKSVPPNLTEFAFTLSLLAAALSLDGVALVVIRVRQQASLFATVEICRACSYALMVYVFLHHGLRYRAPLWADIIATTAEAVLLLSICFIKRSDPLIAEKPADATAKSAIWAHLSPALAFGVPLIPGELANWITGLSSRFVLARFLNAADVGVFAFGYTIASGLAMVASAINNAYAPYFFGTASKPHGPRTLSSAGILFAYIMGLGTLTVITLARPLILLLGNARYTAALPVIDLAVIGFFFQALYLLVANALYFKKATKWFPLASGVTAVVNLCCNFVLVPWIGFVGAAVSSVISYCVLFGIIYYFSQRELPLPYSWRLLAIAAVVSSIGLAMLPMNTVMRVILLAAYSSLVVLIARVFSEYRKGHMDSKVLDADQVEDVTASIRDHSIGT